MITINDFPHAAFQCNRNLLSGFLSVVTDKSSFDIFLFQVYHVGKTHPLGVEAEHEQIP